MASLWNPAIPNWTAIGESCAYDRPKWSLLDVEKRAYFSTSSRHALHSAQRVQLFRCSNSSLSRSRKKRLTSISTFVQADGFSVRKSEWLATSWAYDVHEDTSHIMDTWQDTGRTWRTTSSNSLYTVAKQLDRRVATHQRTASRAPWRRPMCVAFRESSLATLTK